MGRLFDNDLEAGREAFIMAERIDEQMNKGLIDSTLIGKIYLHHKQIGWAKEQFEKVVRKQQQSASTSSTADVSINVTAVEGIDDSPGRTSSATMHMW